MEERLRQAGLRLKGAQQEAATLRANAQDVADAKREATILEQELSQVCTWIELGCTVQNAISKLIHTRVLVLTRQHILQVSMLNGTNLGWIMHMRRNRCV
jgi:hypothetical protein